jgi:hypothetical protein
MSEKDQIHTLLTDLADQDPPVDIDLDRQIKRGQRRVRRRTVTISVAALAIPVLLVGGIVTFRPDGDRSEPPVAGPGTPTATTPGVTPRTVRLPGKSKVESTEQSRALLDQVKSVIPELSYLPGGRLYDMEMVLGSEDTLHAGSDWIWPEPAAQVTVDVEVGRRGTVPRVCEGKTGINACTEIKHLPDGSTAYLHTYIVPGGTGHAYDVRLDRADGISVTVSSAAIKPKDAKNDAPLSLARVLEIARKITVKPGN